MAAPKPVSSKSNAKTGGGSSMRQFLDKLGL
eukprot:COSAG02_NODE_49751_length_325_cov_0.495575_2_plen_30_part_01